MALCGRQRSRNAPSHPLPVWSWGGRQYPRGVAAAVSRPWTSEARVHLRAGARALVSVRACVCVCGFTTTQKLLQEGGIFIGGCHGPSRPEVTEV